ncbi:MAG: hypothetical protein ACOC0V_00105 [Oceanicaulis sp.]
MEVRAMFGGEKAAERRREMMRLADQAADHALDALAEGDPKRAKKELAVVPKKISFADGGWKPALALAVAELALGRKRAGITRMADVMAGLDETNLSRDDKAYLRLYALYRAIDYSKDGKAPPELRAQADDIRFDQILVSRHLKQRFPLKKVEETVPAPPPMARPPAARDL